MRLLGIFQYHIFLFNLGLCIIVQYLIYRIHVFVVLISNLVQQEPGPLPEVVRMVSERIGGPFGLFAYIQSTVLQSYSTIPIIAIIC